MTAKKTKTAKKLEYQASIKVLGAIYRGEGVSAMDAIGHLKPPGTPRGVSVLSVSKGERICTKVLGSPLTYRLFAASPLMREIAIKQLTMFFDL